MLKKTLAASAAMLALACSSASAATYTLPWTGTYTEDRAFGGCDDPPSETGPCTTVVQASGILTVPVDSDADGEFFLDHVDVDLGYNGWAIAGDDKIVLDLVVHDGWINSLYAFGWSQTHLSQFVVSVDNGTGGIDFLNQGTHAYQELLATISVPEPASLGLLLVGLPLVAWRRRRIS